MFGTLLFSFVVVVKCWAVGIFICYVTKPGTSHFSDLSFPGQLTIISAMYGVAAFVMWTMFADFERIFG